MAERDDARRVAVFERLRYGPLKAGYHGGAHPAEVVVPVILLRPATADIGDHEVLPPQEPRSWLGPVSASLPAPTQPPAAPTSGRRRGSASESGPPLFDLTPQVKPSRSVGTAVVESQVYEHQLALNTRLGSARPLPIAAVIDAAAATRDGRLAPTVAAQALGVSLARLRGAQEHVKQLLNVDGYPVLRLDSDGETLVLDVDLLCQQFGVSRDR